MPALLALSLIPLLGHWDLPAALLLALSSLIYGAMAFAKTRMPLHFDVGDKSRYQV